MSTTLLTAKITWAAILLWFDFFMAPSFNLFGVVLAVMAIDLVTGLTKAKFKKIERTSEGLRKTIVKLMQYIIPIFIFWGAGRFIPEYKDRLQQASGWVMMFIIYIEVTSIFENLYEIDKKSIISKFLYKPALKILKFGIENNAVTAAAEKVPEKITPQP